MKKKDFLILGIGVIAFIALLYMVVREKTIALDEEILFWVVSHRAASLNTLVEGITYIGNWESISILCVLLLISLKTRETYGIPVATIAITTTLINKLIKILVVRPRPDEVIFLIEQGGNSFPSGHAITSMGVFLLLAILIYKNCSKGIKKEILVAVTGFLSFSIGLSRIYLGVHYPTDVLGGWLLAWLLLYILLILKRFLDLDQKIGSWRK